MVDNVPAVLSMKTEMLRNAGFDVLPVSSGEEAVARLPTLELDALVTDFAMPGIDGGQLAASAIQIHPGLPTLILTGNAEIGRLDTIPPHAIVIRKPIASDAITRRTCEAMAGGPAATQNRHGTAGKRLITSPASPPGTPAASQRRTRPSRSSHAPASPHSPGSGKPARSAPAASPDPSTPSPAGSARHRPN